MVRRSWRDQSAGRRFSRWWRPWYSLNPFKRRGTRINERDGFGIRDLVAAPSDVANNPLLRWRVIGSFFLLLFLFLVLRLFMLQIVDYHRSLEAVQLNSLRSNTTPATRGEIRDRNGVVLVGNVTTVEIRLSKAEAKLHPQVRGALAAITGLSLADVTRKLHDVRYLAYQPIPILLDTPPALQEYLTLHAAEFPGVTLTKVSHRTYPVSGVLAPHVLGYVGPINNYELAAHPNMGYQADSTIGKTGVEQFYEAYLRGRDGVRTLRVDRVGTILGVVSNTSATVGDTVVLNIDAGLQAQLDASLSQAIARARGSVDTRSNRHPPAPNGAAIVLDPNNGHVLAMSSYPGYDLNSFVSGLSQSMFNGLLNTGAFNNFAIQGTYTPGSTFKMVSATAQLQSGVMSAASVLNDNGTYTVPGCLQGYHGCVFHDDETNGSGPVNLARALTVSSDYYFYNLGYLFWRNTHRYGLTPIQDVAAQYGLDSPTQIDLPSENTGRVDSPSLRKALHAAAPKAYPYYQWYTGDNLQMAFGQGSTAVTPLEMATAYATFANGGTRYAPEVVNSVIDPHGKVVRTYGPKVLGHVNLPPGVRSPILQGLAGVVNNPSGTAYGAFHHYANFSLSSFVIAGKTGTASNAAGQEPNAWFVGFGPAAHPQYVVLCVIGQGGYGASAAAPVVAQAFNYLVAHPIKPVKLGVQH